MTGSSECANIDSSFASATVFRVLVSNRVVLALLRETSRKRDLFPLVNMRRRIVKGGQFFFAPLRSRSRAPT